MATRFYLPSANTTPAYTPTPRGWNNTANAGAAQETDITKAGDSDQAYVQISCNTTSGLQYHLARQFVSKPLAAQTISGTLTASIKCYESGNSANSCLSIGVYLIDSSGAYKSTLISPNQCTDSMASPREFTTAAGSRRLYNTSETLGIAYGSTSIAAGDRLVIEVGFVETATSASYYSRIYFGDGETADLSYAEADTGVENGWVEFTSDISFGATQKSVSQSGSGSDSIGIVRKSTIQEYRPLVSKNILDLNIANGCEDGTWSGDWTEVDTDGLMTVSVDTDNEYSGSRCLKLAVSGDTSNYNYVETADQAVSPSVYYTVSARVKTGGSGTGLLGLLWSDSSHTYIENNHVSFTNTSYEKKSFTQSMPSNAAYVHVYFTVDPGTGARSLYGDEFQLEQASSATDWESPDIAGHNASESLSKQEKTQISLPDSGTDGETLVPKIRTTINEPIVVSGGDSKNKLPLNIANGTEDGTWSNEWSCEDSNCTISSTTSYKYAGNRSLSFVWSTSQVDYSITSTLFPVEPETDYVLSIYMACANPQFDVDGNHGYIEIVCVDESLMSTGGDSTVWYFDYYEDEAYEFKRFTVAFNSGENAANGMIFLSPYSEDATVRIFADCFQLEEGTSATAYEDPGTGGNITETITKAEGSNSKNVTDSGTDSETIPIAVQITTKEEVEAGENRLTPNAANGCENGLLDDWTPDSCNISSSTNYAYAGNRSVKIDFTADSGITYAYLLPAAEAIDVCFSAYIKSSGFDTDAGYIGIYFYDGDGVYLGGNSTTFDNETSFTRIYVTATAPTDTIYAMAWIWGDTDGAIAYIDQLQYEVFASTPSTWEAPKGVNDGLIFNRLSQLELYDDLEAFYVENISAKGKIVAQESGSGGDTPTFKMKPFIQQTGSGADAQTLNVKSTIADSKALSDSLAIKNMFKTTDTATGNDIANVASNILAQDTFSVAETIIRDKLIPLLESAAGSDSPILKKISLLLESGNSTELFNIINRFTIQQTGQGTETVSQTKKFATPDSGTGSDVLAIAMDILAQDSGTVAETLIRDKLIPILETTQGAESPILKKISLLMDSGDTTELFNFINRFIVQQSASGAEVITPKISNIAQDSGYGTDLSLLQTFVTLSQSASATDALAIITEQLRTDNGTGSDLTSLKNKFNVTQTGSNIDVLNLKNVFTIPETKTLTDTPTLKRISTTLETATGTDAAIIKAIISRIETATGTDVITLVAHILQTESLSSSEALSLLALIDVAESPVGVDSAYKDQQTMTKSVQDSDSLADALAIISRFTVAQAGSGVDTMALKVAPLITDSQSNLFTKEQEEMEVLSVYAEGDTPPTITQSTDYVKSGAHSLKIQWNHTGGNYWSGRAMSAAVYPVPLGRGVKFSIWVYAPEEFQVDAYVTGSNACCYRTVTLGPYWQKLIFGYTNDWGPDEGYEYITFLNPSALKIMYVDVLEAFWSDGFTVKPKLSVSQSASGADSPAIKNTFVVPEFKKNLVLPGQATCENTALFRIAGTLTTEVSTEQAHQGTYSIKCTTGVSEGGGICQHDNYWTPTNKGEVYTASAWVYMPAGQSFWTDIYDNQVPGYTHRVNETGTGTWQKVTNTFTANGYVSRFYVYCSNANKVFYIDEFQIEKGDTATTWEYPSLREQVQKITQKNTFTIPQAGSGAETPSLKTTVPLLEAGTDVENISQKNKFTVPQTGTGSDSPTLMTNRFTIPQTGAGTDLPSLKNTFKIFEAMDEQEALALKNTLALTQAGSGVEATAVKTFKTLTDPSISSELVSLAVKIIQTESLSVSEYLLLNKFITLVEAGYGSDEASTGERDVKVTDDADILEALALINNLTITQANLSITEIPSAIPKIPITQSGYGTDTTTIKNSIGILEWDKNKNLCFANIATAGDSQDNIEGFERYVSSELTDITRDTSTFYSGTGSIKQFVPSGSYGIKTSLISISPSKTYTASLKIKGINPSQYKIGLREIRADGSTIGTTYTSALTFTGNWDNVNLTRTCGSEARFMRILVLKYGTEDTTIWSDNYQIEENNIQTDWTYPGGIDTLINMTNHLTIQQTAVLADIIAGLKKYIQITDEYGVSDSVSLRVIAGIMESLDATDDLIFTSYLTVSDTYELEEVLDVQTGTFTLREGQSFIDDLSIKAFIFVAEQSTGHELLYFTELLDLGDVQVDMLFVMDVTVDDAITGDVVVDTAVYDEIIIDEDDADDAIVDEKEEEDIYYD
jgi:hypothetical protein